APPRLRGANVASQLFLCRAATPPRLRRGAKVLLPTSIERLKMSFTRKPHRRNVMPKRINGKIVAILVLMAMVSASSVRGADNLGVLQGVVKDAAGAPVAGAVVKMKSAERRLTF